MRILSLGFGVQSTILALKILAGEIEPVDAAIFADTGSEPRKVYDHARWLVGEIGDAFPVIFASKGNLGEDTLAAQRGELKRLGQAPFYVKSAGDVQGGGMIWRQCTKDYKLEVIRREVRKLYLAAGKPHVEQVIGISFDERSRMKESGVSYITNVYPLIEQRITRQDCLNWLTAHGYPTPPKSACIFCPYTSNARWRDMKKNDPDEFERVCQFDEALREGDRRLPGVTGRAYVHRSFIPLREVKFAHEEQLDFQYGFENECDGMCGV